MLIDNDYPFLTSEDAESVLGIPVLGHIPKTDEPGLRLLRDISTFSPLVESNRSLRTNLRFVAEQPLRSLAIISAVPAEGKSTVLANLAMAMAMDGKRVIVVDADLRRPTQHKLFNQDAGPGLAELLAGTQTLSHVLRPTGVERVSLIGAGSPPPNATELLGSDAMQNLLTELQDHCDTVLIDTSPLLAVADAMLVSSLVSGVLLVIGQGETTRGNVKKTLELLARAKATVWGTVLNRVEGGHYYYYGKYYVPTPTEDSAEKA